MLPRVILAAVVLVAATALTATSASAAMIPIYSNSLRSADARADLFLKFGERCGRGGNQQFMRVRVGPETPDCDLAPPVVGRDLGISAIAALTSGTPRTLRRHAYVSLGLRAGDGGSVKALVYPPARAVQVVKTTPEGRRGLIAAERDVRGIRGLDRANRIILRAVNAGHRGNCRIIVHVNGRRVITANDPRCAQLTGRMATVGTGSFRRSQGITAAFRNLQVSVPNPFVR